MVRAGAPMRGEVSYVFVTRSHADHGEASDAEAVADGALGADGAPSRTSVGACVGRGRRSEVFEVGGVGAGEAVVGEVVPR